MQRTQHSVTLVVSKKPNQTPSVVNLKFDFASSSLTPHITFLVRIVLYKTLCNLIISLTYTLCLSIESSSPSMASCKFLLPCLLLLLSCLNLMNHETWVHSNLYGFIMFCSHRIIFIEKDWNFGDSEKKGLPLKQSGLNLIIDWRSKVEAFSLYSACYEIQSYFFYICPWDLLFVKCKFQIFFYP